MANSGAFKNNSLITYIVGDASQFEKTLKKATNDVNTFQKNVAVAGKKNAANGGALGTPFGRGSKVNQGLRGLASGTGLGSAALFGSGAFIGAAISAAALKKSITAASDLNEQITKSQQVFGASDKAILKWSQDTATNLGISQRAALEAAGTFGNLFKAQGFGNAKNSQLSKQLVQLASDLASFNNIDPTQVLQDLNSAIVGEIEPVRKYGVDLRVARVQQDALARSGKTNVKALTQQELTLARLHLLFKDTAAAQGDYARTSGGLANTQRRLSAEVENLEASLGTLLLPAVTEIVDSLAKLAHGSVVAVDELGKLSHIEIPPIKIPLFFDFPGTGGGPILGVKFNDSLIDVVSNIINHFKGGGGSTKLAQAAGKFEDKIKPLFTSPINDAIQNIGKSTKKGGAANPFKNLTIVNKTNLSNLIDSLNLGLDKADLTSTSSDNIALLKQLVEAYQQEVDFGIDAKNAAKNLIATKKQLQDAVKGAASEKFSNIIDSLNLGVEKSQVTGSLQQQNAALEALKAGLEKQIKAGVDVQSAQHQVVAVNAQIVANQQQIKQDGIDKILSGLQTAVDKAALTKGLGDDLVALKRQAAGLRAQIKAGNDVTNNQSQLVSVLGAIREKKAEIAQAQKDATQAGQFRALGLSSTGDEIVPGLKNLSSRISETLKKVSTGELDISSKLAGRLKAAQTLIKKEGKNLTEATRSQINDFIKAANGDDSKEKLKGPLTATTSLNTNAVLKGLGLSEEERKALSGRLSKFNSAGVRIAGSGVAASAGGFPVNATSPVVNVNVELDGKQVAKSVTVNQQKKSRRNPKQKRGPTVQHHT